MREIYDKSFQPRANLILIVKGVVLQVNLALCLTVKGVILQVTLGLVGFKESNCLMKQRCQLSSKAYKS